MSSVTFLPDDKEESVIGDETILETALRTDIPLAQVCRGNARCSTCRIQVLEGLENVSPRSEKEKNITDHMGFGPEIRLACQTRVTGSAKVRRLILDNSDVEFSSLLINELDSSRAGVEKNVLILFADIRGFTLLSENLLPYDVIHILNRYFHLMNEVVTRYGGRIDNYMGDGLMAIFEVGRPERDLLQGIQAGLEMLEVADGQIQPYVRTFFGGKFTIGIGLHYGLVVAGTVGGRDNRKHTIIGDAVNFASRIEACNKELGTQFLISDDVYTPVKKDVLINSTHNVVIKGKTGTQALYEVSGLARAG